MFGEDGPYFTVETVPSVFTIPDYSHGLFKKDVAILKGFRHRLNTVLW